MFAHRSDIGPIDDTDLLLVRPDVPSENNAYETFACATNALRLIEKHRLVNFLWGDTNEVVVSHEQIIILLETNKMLMTTISTGLHKEFCFRERSLQLPTLASEFAYMNLLFLTQAKIFMDSGKVGEALDAILSSLSFGTLIQKDAEFIIEALSGFNMISQSLTFVEQIIDQNELTSNQRSDLIQQLSKLDNLRIGLANGYKSEYAFAAKELENLVESIQKEQQTTGTIEKFTGQGYAFKPNATKKVSAEYWRLQINNLNYPNCVKAQDDTLIVRVPEGSVQRILFYLKENFMGRMFLSLTIQSDLSCAHQEIYSTEKKVLDLKKKLLVGQINTDKL